MPRGACVWDGTAHGRPDPATTGVDPDDVTPRTWPVAGRHTLRDATQQPHRQKQNVDGGGRGPGLRGRRAVVSWTELRTCRGSAGDPLPSTGDALTTPALCA